MINTYEVAPRAILADDYGALAQKLLDGKLASTITWDWIVIVAVSQGKYGSELIVTETPKWSDDPDSDITLMGAWLYVLTTASERKDAAKKVLGYLLTEEAASVAAKMVGNAVPLRGCESAGKVTPGRRSKGPPFPAGRLGCKPTRALSQPCPVMGTERRRWKRRHPACAVCAVATNGGVAGAGRPVRRWECGEKPTGCLSHARIRAAVRHSRVRKDQAYISPPACVRSQTPRDCRGGCRAMPDIHPGGEAECIPHPASAALGSGGPAAVGNALLARGARAPLLDDLVDPSPLRPPAPVAPAWTAASAAFRRHRRCTCERCFGSLPGHALPVGSTVLLGATCV